MLIFGECNHSIGNRKTLFTSTPLVAQGLRMMYSTALLSECLVQDTTQWKTTQYLASLFRLRILYAMQTVTNSRKTGEDATTREKRHSCLFCPCRSFELRLAELSPKENVRMCFCRARRVCTILVTHRYRTAPAFVCIQWPCRIVYGI